jgi:hypothetical protein
MTTLVNGLGQPFAALQALLKAEEDGKARAPACLNNGQLEGTTNSDNTLQRKYALSYPPYHGSQMYGV